MRGKGRGKATKVFDLVAELRLMLLALIALILGLALMLTSVETVEFATAINRMFDFGEQTQISASQTSSTSLDNRDQPDAMSTTQLLMTTSIDQTMTTTILATSTMEDVSNTQDHGLNSKRGSVTDYIRAVVSGGGLQSVSNVFGNTDMDPEHTGLSTMTSSTTILAISTTHGQSKAVGLIESLLKQSHRDAEMSIKRIDQLRQLLQKDLEPGVLVEQLQILGIMGADDEPDVTSLLEQNLSLVVPTSSNVVHDDWWYQTDDDELENENQSNLTTDGMFQRNKTESSNNSANGSEVSRNRWFWFADPRLLVSMRDASRRTPGSLSTFHWNLKHRLHLIMIMLGSVMICSAIGMMQQNRPFGNRQVPHGYQADIGTATLKNPSIMVL